MSAPTLEALKLAVAKMLPTHILIRDDSLSRGTPMFNWRFFPSGEPASSLGVEIACREWLHVCWLAEQTLDESEKAAYDTLLDIHVTKRHPQGLEPYIWNACAEYRLLILCRVKCPEIFNTTTP